MLSILLLAGGVLLIPSKAPGSRSIQQSTAGGDTLRGGDESDVLQGTEGNDLLEGAAGDDRLSGANGDDVLRGGPGNDVLEAGAGTDVLEGGPGDDFLVGGDGRNWLFGEDGDDILRGGPGRDVLDGGGGHDDLDGRAGDDIMDGGEGNDVLRGGENDDTIDGGDGSDTLDGGAGNDDLDGGDDNDILVGGDGNDKLSGADGSDYLDGGQGHDNLDGGDEDDILIGGVGDDTLMGGDGKDKLIGGPGNDLMAGGDNDDILEGGAGTDLLSGGDGDDILDGGVGNDTLFGFRGNDHLRGGADSDLLRGGEGEDLLNGGAGDDRLLGGLGTDNVQGGEGSDLIILRIGDVDSMRIETVDGGTDTLMSIDTLRLNGFTPRDISALDRGQTVQAVQAVQAVTVPDSLPGHTSGLLLSDPLTGGVYIIDRVERIVYSHFYPQIASDEDRSSALVLVNPSRAEPSNGSINFSGDDGKAAPVAVNRNPAESTFEFSIPPMGRIDLVLEGRGGGEPVAGAAQLLADRPVGGMVQAAFPGFGRTGVAESPLVDGFIIPVWVDQVRGVTTGVALRNSGAETALKLTLVGPEGEVEASDIDLPANSHIVKFVHDVFPSFTDFQGTLLVQGGPTAGTAILVGPNLGEFTTAPVIPLEQPLGRPLYFAHVANGDNFVSSIVVLNPSFPDTARGNVAFFDANGEALEMDLVGFGPVSSVPFELAPGRTAVFTTSGEGGFVEGSARAVVDTGRVGGVLRFSIPRVGFVGLGPSRPLDAFISPVMRSERQGLTTLLAVHSTGSALTLNLTLRNSDGVAVPRGTTSVELPANGHFARRVDELFPAADTRDFRGTLTATVDGGTVSATAIQLGTDPGQLLTLPVTRLY